MQLLEHNLYQEDLASIANLPLPWNKLSGKTILIAGATGMIGRLLVDVLMTKTDVPCKIVAIARNYSKAEICFSQHIGMENFVFICGDICHLVDLADMRIDFIVQAASNTHPMLYSTDPIGTIAANVVGTNNLLNLAAKSKAERFVFVSSNEIYGENRGDVDFFDESYCGYIDANTLRAGYPESKRCGEALCQAYIRQAGLDCVIVRLTRTFGPTLSAADTKVVSQFLHNALQKEDVVLKSSGNQYYSYVYAADAVSGLLTVLLKGKCGEAYNVAAESCDIRLKDLAKMLAEMAGTRIVFEKPDEIESRGYSRATKARLSSAKIAQELGWKSHYGLKEALCRTITILRECNSKWGLK